MNFYFKTGKYPGATASSARNEKWRPSVAQTLTVEFTDVSHGFFNVQWLSFSVMVFGCFRDHYSVWFSDFTFFIHLNLLRIIQARVLYFRASVFHTHVSRRGSTRWSHITSWWTRTTTWQLRITSDSTWSSDSTNSRVRTFPDRNQEMVSQTIYTNAPWSQSDDATTDVFSTTTHGGGNFP